MIARKAEAALSSNLRQVPAEPTPQELIAKIVVYPKGATLPESFLKQTWGSGDFVSPLVCAREATNVEPCEAFFADFDGDGQPEILLRGRFRIGVLRLAPDGRWTRLGYIDQSQCASIVDGLRAGRVRAVPATQNDLEVNGKRVRLIPPCE